MKKIIFALLIVLACVLAGCNAELTDDVQGSTELSVEQPDPTQDEAQSHLPGTYTEPAGFVKSRKYSSDDKIFYVEKEHENDEMPDNIAINVGENRYSLKEHAAFRDAIVQQILWQLDGVKADLNGDGTYTEQGYILYVFTIKEEETGFVTKQYYIVDDYRYCLVQLTNYTGSESVDEAARIMVDSFVWNDLQ